MRPFLGLFRTPCLPPLAATPPPPPPRRHADAEEAAEGTDYTPDEIRQMCDSYDLQNDTYQEEAMLSIVVVGGSGDLAKKKIFPALFALYHQGLLPKHVQIVGYARSKASPEEFREKIMGTLSCRVDKGCALRRLSAWTGRDCSRPRLCCG